jgi:hypothetical protein
MEHISILKRAWKILWDYRILWIFGIILSLTTANASEEIISFNGDGWDQREYYEGITLQPGDDIREEVKEAFESLGRGMEILIEDEFPRQVANNLLVIGISLACVILILIIVANIARYVSETALIKLVDDYEESGEKRSFKEGFRLGWSKGAWRLFLIDLVINLPITLAFIIMFLIVLAPLLLWTLGLTAAGVIGVVATIGLFFLTIMLLIIVSVSLKLLKRFFRMVCILEDVGVIDAIRLGFAFVRRNIKDVGLMWLIMIGISIAFSIVLIPIGLMVLMIAGVAAGLAAAVVGGITSLFMSPWILAAIIGVPIFLLLMIVPLGFIGGLFMTYVSTTWTLTYRELRATERLSAGLPDDDLDLDLDLEDYQPKALAENAEE